MVTHSKPLPPYDQLLPLPTPCFKMFLERSLNDPHHPTSSIFHCYPLPHPPPSPPKNFDHTLATTETFRDHAVTYVDQYGSLSAKIDQHYFSAILALISYSTHFGISSSFLMVRHNINMHLIIFLKYSYNVISRRFRLTFHSNQHISVPYPKHNFQGNQPSKYQTNQNVQTISITQIKVQ